MKKISLLVLFAALLFTTAKAQIETPAPSPLCTVAQKVGLTDVTITYSRPGKKGREIYGGLVPYGKLWRTGANVATKISFSDPVTFGSESIPAGEYALFSIPDENEWTVILNSNVNQGGTGSYDEELDVARITVPSSTFDGETVQSFTIMVTDLTNTGANISIDWENTSVSIPIGVNTDEQVMAQIDRVMTNPEMSVANTYYQSASYYYAENKDAKKALEWINKSVEIDDSRYWVVHLKAKLEARNNLPVSAIETAKKSKELAKKAGNMDYVRLNEQVIAKAEAMR
jgi:hypothetical protein